MKANQLMVDACDCLVCYVRHGASNSRNLLEYAQRREKKGLIQIINVHNRNSCDDYTKDYIDKKRNI